MTAAQLELRRILALHPFDDWHEDQGPVLWWTIPIECPPWSGTPLDDSWPFDDKDAVQWSVIPPVWRTLPGDPEKGGAT